ncbi:uncharacterized protein [Penaeus vannamei]|uniref:uncharacterized protein isoform X1 n=1 Tax=Penaeus vannamei TaxID=6689 RepID=UPI00387F84E1
MWMSVTFLRAWAVCSWVMIHALAPYVTAQDILRDDPLALLAGTLRTLQRHACDGTALTLQCPVNTTIDVLYAKYGRPRQEAEQLDLCPPLPHHARPAPKRHCEYSSTVDYNTLQRVVGECHHKNQCRIQVSPETFSDHDPCPEIRKYIEVAYKCRPERFINKIVCEGGELTLKCGKNSRLAIYSVLFGRSKEGSYMCPQPAGVPEEDCQASFATEMVMSQCHGKRQCELHANSSMYGKPCSPESRMYMKTVYTCVPRKILKEPYQGELEPDEQPEEIPEESSMMSPPAMPPVRRPDPPPPQSSTSYPHETKTTTVFYNPTVTTKLPEKKGDNGVRDYPQDGVPRSQPDLINCTVTILSGSKNREIGFLTEWMRAVAFIKKNFEKFILYLMVGLCVGLLLFLFVVVGRLLLERHLAKREAKNVNDPLTSVFATDIDDIDGDLDRSAPHGSYLCFSPSAQEPQHDVVRYTTIRSGIRQQDSDTNPRSLSRTNNNQLFYS